MYRTSIWEDIKHQFVSGNIVSRLIIINVAVFLLINIVRIVLFLMSPDAGFNNAMFNNMLGWIMLPADVMQLLKRPWTVITHMFAHYQLLHILFNMLWLYWFGRIIQEFIGNKKILPIYILGGLTGAVLMVLSYNIFPGLQGSVEVVRALGASAGVLAIVVAAATLVPDYTVFLLFFGGVRIKYIAIVIVIIDLVSIPGFNTGGHIAHLGGALFGFVFIKQLQVGHDWSAPFNSFFERIGNLFRRKKEPHVVYKTQSRKRTKTPERSVDKQQRMDEILDKIASSGYDSLSKEEKEFLFRMSKES